MELHAEDTKELTCQCRLSQGWCGWSVVVVHTYPFEAVGPSEIPMSLRHANCIVGHMECIGHWGALVAMPDPP